MPERTGISGAGGRPAVPSACRPQPPLTRRGLPARSAFAPLLRAQQTSNAPDPQLPIMSAHLRLWPARAIQLRVQIQLPLPRNLLPSAGACRLPSTPTELSRQSVTAESARGLLRFPERKVATRKNDDSRQRVVHVRVEDAEKNVLNVFPKDLEVTKPRAQLDKKGYRA
jgi:hypothetical protein